MILALLKSSVKSIQDVKSKGAWDNRKYFIRDLRELEVGIIGLGNIGSKVAYLCNAFGAKISAYDPYLKDDEFPNYVKKISLKNTSITVDASAFYTHFNNRILPDYETDPTKIIYSNLNGYSVSKGLSLNSDIAFSSGLTMILGATLMDVSINENNIKKRQLLTESFSGVWSISYKLKKSKIKIDYTGNLYGPMKLPRLGDLDPRRENSPWFSIQNIQITKRIGNSWEIYGGIKNLLNFTPANNSIARSFDPFDTGVDFDSNGQAIATPNNPNALTFDPSYVYASNQGIRGFIGFRYTIF
jgi:outer membrane receptor for ferrienterochelin and colicins